MSDIKQIDLEFVTIDFWGRAIYKWVDKQAYFSSLNVLFPNKEIAPNGTKEEINAYFRSNPGALTYHGTDIEDDPDGRMSSKWKLNIVD